MIKVLNIFLALISSISIYLTSILDDIFLDIYIATKEFTCLDLGISENVFYPASFLFQFGLCLGSIIFTILQYSVSIKKSMIFCQICLILSLLTSVFSRNISLLLYIRIANGFFISGIILGISILIKTSYKKYEFNQYIALTTFMTCAIDAIVTKFGESIALKFGVRSATIFLIIVVLLSFLVFYKNNYKILHKHIPLACAVKTTCTEYISLIFSPFIILLFSIGISEGIIDLFLNLVSKILGNIYSGEMTFVGNTIGIISIISSLSVLLYSYQSNNSDENNQKNYINFKYIVILLIFSILYLFFNPTHANPKIAHICVIICAILIISTVYIINYYIQKTLYSDYNKNPGIIASGIILFEALFSFFIQKYGEFFLEIDDNAIIFRYLSIYLIILLVLLSAFMKFYKKDKTKL